MANKEWTTTFYNSTAAQFNAWGQSVTDALEDVGMVKLYTSASWNFSETNWSSPGVQERLFEVWRFPATVGLPEIYIRIGYGQFGTSGNSVSYPRISVRIGSSYPSAGVVSGLSNLTGNLFDVIYSTPTTPVLNYISCDDNGLAMVIGANYSVQNYSYFGKNCLIIDRFRDENGDPLDYGASMFTMKPYYSGDGGTSVYFYDLNENEGHLFASGGGGVAPCVTRGNISTTGDYRNAFGQTQIYPWWGVVRSGHGLSKMICTYATPDRLANQEEPVAWLNTSTERVIKTVGYTTAPTDIGTSSNLSYAIWWND